MMLTFITIELQYFVLNMDDMYIERDTEREREKVIATCLEIERHKHCFIENCIGEKVGLF